MTLYRYLPVMNGNESTSPFKWWVMKTSDNILPYKYGLGSFHYLKGRSRRDFKLPEDFYFFGDSGGFSVVTLGAIVNPIECYQWQANNCDIGVILDMPPYVFSGTAQFGGNAADIFDERLELTKRNVRMVKESVYNENDRVDWWVVIQGETHKQRVKWFTELNKIHEFTGAALSPKPSYDWLQITGQMLYAHQLGLKKIHVLQVSSVNSIALIIFINKLLGEFFDVITFDSSTPIRMASTGHYQVFDKESFSFKNIKSRKQFVCDCELCQQARKLMVKAHWCSKNPNLLRSLHSIVTIVKTVKFLESVSEDELEEKLISKRPQEFLKVKHMIHTYLDKGNIIDFYETKNYKTKSFFKLLK